MDGRLAPPAGDDPVPANDGPDLPLSFRLDELEERLGYRFENRALIEQALTHASFANDRREASNERLEFLGDSVLGTIAADFLFRALPRAAEGELSRIKSRVVSMDALARRARRLDLGSTLRLGRGEERSGGRDKRSLLGCALEAVIGAVFLDGGFEAARHVVEPWVEAEADAAEVIETPDAKSRLQELLQGEGREPPEYRHVNREGPDHEPQFLVECRIDGQTAAVAWGHSKKAAERSAARQALDAPGANAAERSAAALLSGLPRPLRAGELQKVARKVAKKRARNTS